jgi:hypothetical protein
MSDAKETAATRPESRVKTEEEVRAEMLSLASAMINKAKTAATAAETQAYAESAAALFGAAARARPRLEGDPPPTGG